MAAPILMTVDDYFNTPETVKPISRRRLLSGSVLA